MTVHRRLVVLLAGWLFALSFSVGVGQADATESRDTPDCAASGEYNDLHELMTLAEVRALFDIPGRYENDNPSGTTYRYSFDACNGLSSGRVWCAFRYDGLGLTRWWLAD